MFHYGQNSIGTLVGFPEFTYLGAIYSYHCGRPEYSGGSDQNQNSGNSSDPNRVFANNNRQCPHKSKILFN